MKFDCLFTITHTELSTKLEYYHTQHSDDENLVIRASLQHLTGVVQDSIAKVDTLLTISYDVALPHPHIQNYVSEAVTLN